MKKSLIVIISVFILFGMFCLLSEEALADNTYYGKIYSQELTADKYSWSGMIYRRGFKQELLDREFGVGVEIEGIFSLGSRKDNLDEVEDKVAVQMNPGFLVATNKKFDTYMGINFVTAFSDYTWFIWKDRFHAKFGMQLEVKDVNLFAQTRTVVPIDIDLPFSTFERNGIEFGVLFDF